MKAMSLTQGKTTVVDDDVYEWASRVRWFALYTRGKWYAARTVVGPNGRPTTEYLHRRIVGAAGGQDTDHRDGDGLNNCRKNIRVVTHKQNQENVRAGYGKCGVRGVTQTRSGRYRAQAKVSGRHLTFGVFNTIEEAAEAARRGRLATMTHSDGR